MSPATERVEISARHSRFGACSGGQVGIYRMLLNGVMTQLVKGGCA